MSKGLRNMERNERLLAIDRRIKSQTMGLGYWGAIDAKKREGEKKEEKK